VDKQYDVHIMTNASRTLYTGVTNNLERRVLELKSGRGSTFTSKYRIYSLVYYETYGDVRQAIAREKQIKSWRRSKKTDLVEAFNPNLRDLSVDWLQP